jgi:hypothetical protein
MTVGLLQGILEAIGESDNSLGGLYQTRLTAAVGPLTVLSATFTWDGTTTVLTADTSEVEAGDWIALDSDGTLFEVGSVTTDTSVTLLNPIGYPIPTGATSTSKATRSLPVESALNWADSGKVGLDGMVYHYASRTNTSLDEITFLAGGESIVGLNRRHRVEATVVNLNRELSAVDAVRRAILVNYAEGEDLSALGRNLGVNRIGFFADDDVFREVIKATAYAPKGTVLGLKFALNALVGEGNYEIYEDLINYPNQVFITLPSGALITAEFRGKTYLNHCDYVPLSSATTVEVSNELPDNAVIQHVRLKTQDWFTDTRTAYPSADTRVEYDGDTGTQIWPLVGGAVEGVDIVLGADYMEFVNAPALYAGRKHVIQESDVDFEARLTVPLGTPAAPAGSIMQGLYVSDTFKAYNLGVHAISASTFQIGFVEGIYPTKTFVAGTTVTLNQGQWYDVRLVKRETDNAEIWVDGVRRVSLDYSSLPGGSTSPVVQIGRYNPPSGTPFRIQSIAFKAVTLKDLASFSSPWGFTYNIYPTEFDNYGSFTFIPDDVGKLIKISGAASGTAYKSTEGRWLITDWVTNRRVEVRGVPQTGLVAQAGGNPLRIQASGIGQQFSYPEDIGKNIAISGSTLGNNGTYVIDKLLAPGTLEDLSLAKPAASAKTSIAEVVSASFVPETGLNWQFFPDFPTQYSLDWVMAGSYSVSGTTVTLRQSVPIWSTVFSPVVEVCYSRVLSGQILFDIAIEGDVYYAMYLTDPLAFVKEYLDTITAAGVIPDFIVE